MLARDPAIASLRWLAVASAADARELYWFLFDYLLPQGWLGKGVADGQITITPTGWQEFACLQQVNLGSRIGFVAMSFRDEFQRLYDNGIEPGIRAAGYEALRVDRTEHNNRIDDEIVAIIKRSRFVVADFSVNRGGIYFEAGFASGLGIPVVWVVKEDQLAFRLDVLDVIEEVREPEARGVEGLQLAVPRQPVRLLIDDLVANAVAGGSLRRIVR